MLMVNSILIKYLNGPEYFNHYSSTKLHEKNFDVDLREREKENIICLLFFFACRGIENQLHDLQIQ